MKELREKESQHYQKMLAYNENPNTLNYDLQYQRIDISVNPTELFVEGTVTSHFTPNQNISSIYFDLSDNLTVSEVKYHGVNLFFTQLPTKEVRVNFSNAIPANVKDSLSIIYSGIPDSSQDAFNIDYHSSGPVLFTLSEPYGAQEWFPTKQSLNDKIEKVDMLITAPSNYSTASNGKLISETSVEGNKTRTFWQTKYPIPAYLIAIGVSNYVKSTETIGATTFPFVNYVFPETANNGTAMSNINWTKTCMTTFEQYFGPYPYLNEKYGHMEFTWGGGMEHATMSSMGTWSRRIVAHELAHQWFGDKVTCGKWNDIWINEGFATFGEHLANEKLLMNATQFRNYLQDQLSYITLYTDGSVYVSDDDLWSMNAIFDGRLSYAKGGFVLRMIKWILGDELFYQSLRDYHNRPNLAYSYATTEDFAASLLQSTGRDFTGFFQDWIYGEGYPSYNIRWNQAADKRVGFIIGQTQSTNNVDFFELPLPIRINGTNGEVLNIVLNHTQNQQYFEEALNFTVSSIQFNRDLQIIEANSSVVRDNNLSLHELQTQKFAIYPNPVADVLHLKNSRQNEPYQIFDMQGRLVKSGKASTEINVSGFSKGVYVLSLDGSQLKFEKK